MKNRINTLTGYIGSMYSGKSSALQEDIKRFEIAGFSTKIFKPHLDNRYSKSEVATHSGRKMGAIVTKKAKNILSQAMDVDIIGIDEVQFFGFEIVGVIDELISEGKTVVFAGLDMDYLGRPFENTAYLSMMADNILKLNGVCVDCGEDGVYSFKKYNDGERLSVGGTEKYACKCRSCFTESMKEAGYTDDQFGGVINGKY